MRTRFLNIDYFRRPSDETLKGFFVPSLPVPVTSDPDLEIDGRISFSGIDVGVSVDWESLSLGFDGALSLLLSVVLPEICVSEEGKISAAQSASGRTRDLRSGDGEFQESERRSLSFDEEEYGRFRAISGSGNPDIDNGEEELFEFLFGDDESEKYHSCISETLEFEIPERDFEYFGENSKNPQSENSLHIGLGGDNGLLSLEDDTGLMSEGFEKLLSSIEDMPIRIHVDHNSPFSAENNSSVTDRTHAHPRTFPCFEDNSIPLPLTIHFQGVQILDLVPVHSFQNFLHPQEAHTLEIPEQMIEEGVDSSGRFYESLISSELALVDDTFRSLPVPVRCDDDIMVPTTAIFKGVLCKLIPYSVSASDGVYLDWHLSQDEACNRDVCCMCRKLLEEINIDRTAYLPQPSIPDMGVIDFINLDETLEGPCTFQSKEIPSDLPFVGTEFIETATKPTTSHEPREEISHPECRDRNPILSFGRGSPILDSKSQYNDLNYYISARRGGTKRRSESGFKDNAMGKVEPSVVSSEDSTMPCASLEVDSQKQQIEVHQNDIVLEKDCSYPAGDVLKLMNLPKQELVNLITGKTKQSSASASEGPNGVPTISPNFSKLVSLPHVHFLKMELEGSSTLKSLSEDFDVSKLLEILMEGVPRSISVVQERFGVQQFAEVINYVPVAVNNGCIPSGESEYGADPCHNTESSSFPYPMTSKDMDPSMSSLSNTVIIVNTQNYDKEMLISRRSSYQRILALEKGGVQVVEREVNLPVDLIFSAAVCLVWYDAKNVGLSSTTSEEVSSGLPIFVEKITEVLTSMSFAFSDCILVFEGERNFIGTVMESLSGLYAAANILDIHLQIFWSCSPELTDEIILSCIRYAAKSNGGLFPTLPESETLAETFLTKFPSINPLSANAILSSGGMLVEFLKWSNDHRIKAVGRFHVPDESIALFNALCTYGELGESKSGMTETECSSVDSDNNSFKMLPQKKKQKCMVNNTVEIPTDNFLYQQPIFQPSDGFLEPSEALQSYNYRFSNVHEPPQKAENSRFNTNETFSSRKWGINHSVPNNLPPSGTTKSVIGHDDTRGVVVDYDDSFLDEKLHPFVNSSNFWRKPELEMEVAAEPSWPAEKFACSMKNHRVFPTIGEINHDLDGWRQSPKRYKASELSNMDMYRDASQQVIRNSPSLSVHGKGEMTTGRNRFQDPVLSSQLQPGSRRKVQNFGRAKQNRENMISPPLRTSMRGSSSSKGTYTYKKMSPSIIYSYQYEGDSQPKKTNKQNWQKGLGRPPDLSNIHKQASSSLLPTWTPIDKRARQNLSFMRNGDEKQIRATGFTYVSHVLAAAAAVMVLVWCIHFRGGLAFESTNKNLIFNIHPVFMLIGFIILGSEAIISYKALPWSKEVKKLIHLVLHAIALVLVDFWPSHLLLPGATMTFRRDALPWHVIFGLFVYILAIATAELGFLEKLTFLQSSGLDKYGSEAFLVNFTALVVVFLGASVVLSAVLPAQVEDTTGYTEITAP
ncbi:putative ascorbate-specific transmembrane electron transporter 1 [Acorus calamus]|uniref:Ascorbate-specific transmembrane electron transporter 1 n=1 Tax=Acorus calamus TaxID=4465 RepID=A0AAV9E5T8_ACOCL|nr:putative ascorbate-specific transmembrane electron transporter 1 [Acorus calamus]